MKILPTLELLLVDIHLLLSMLFALKVLFYVWTSRESFSTIPHTKVATIFFSKVVIINLSSPFIPKIAVGFLLLAS